MATGLLIRDFQKTYREVRYEREGSLFLSEIEHNAYLNRVTLEITHYDAYRSVSYKTNPDNTHWGYCTSFKGSSVLENIPVKFAKQRVLERVNQGIWNYHQATEHVRMTKTFAELAANSILGSGLLENAQTKIVDLYLSLIENLPNQVEQDLQWILSFTYRPDAPATVSNQNYTGFPVVSPFPDTFKFKADIPCSFLFRLESFYLVNPAVYITANPSETSDATEGEDEYPSPSPGNGSGLGAGFPTPSSIPVGADPRDFAEPVSPGELGNQVTWNATINGTVDFGDSQPPGPLTQTFPFVYSLNGDPFTVDAGDVVTRTKNGITFYNGVTVKDRFGQTVGSFLLGSGWKKGGMTITATIAV